MKIFRFKLGQGGSDKQLSPKTKPRKTRSAKSLEEKYSGLQNRHSVDERCYSGPYSRHVEDRCHSAVKPGSKGSDDSVSLPPISKEGVRVE